MSTSTYHSQSSLELSFLPSSSLLFISPGVLSLCSSPLWCGGPEHPGQDHPWPLSRLLLPALVEVQFHHPSSVRPPKHSQSQRWPDTFLPVPAARGHGLLLPTPPQQPEADKESGPGSVQLGRLSAVVPGRGCEWAAEPASHGARQWRHASVLCGRTGGRGVDLPSWPVQTGETIFEHYQGSVNIVMGRWRERLSGTYLSPHAQVQQEAVRVLLSGGGFGWEDQDQWVSCVSQRHECGGSHLWAVGMEWTSRSADSNVLFFFHDHITNSMHRQTHTVSFSCLFVTSTFLSQGYSGDWRASIKPQWRATAICRWWLLVHFHRRWWNGRRPIWEIWECPEQVRRPLKITEIKDTKVSVYEE